MQAEIRIFERYILSSGGKNPSVSENFEFFQ